jgi:hypothetical protein
VYLPAIEGHVPPNVVHTFHAFLDFCYLVRRNIISEKTIKQIEDALARFHHYRQVFQDVGIVFTFSLPRQHSMKHYPILIRLFGAPNGLCSSITETKHIKAVKEPWRRSSRYKALGQMLVTNQRLDKIAAARRDFNNRGMLQGTCLLQARIDLQVGQDRDIDLSQDAANANVTEFNLDDIEIDDGPTRVDAYVLLAKTKRTCFEWLQSIVRD